jgi:hypothetical protein
MLVSMVVILLLQGIRRFELTWFLMSNTMDATKLGKLAVVTLQMFLWRVYTLASYLYEG